MKKAALALGPLVLCFGWLVPAAKAEELRIPLDVIKAFFDRDKDGTEEKIPFNISELEEFFSYLPGVGSSDAKQVTRKYLSLSYPKGETRINQIIQANIPEASKELILSAAKESVLLQASLDELWGLPSKYIRVIPATHITLASSSGIEVGSLLQQVRNYRNNLHFSTYVRILDGQKQEYLLSTPSAEHSVSEVLEKTKNADLHLKFTVARCEKEKCYASSADDVTASFAFTPMQASRIHANDAIEASCRYEAIYRREYPNKTIIETAFHQCKLNARNGEEPQPVPKLFEKLYPS